MVEKVRPDGAEEVSRGQSIVEALLAKPSQKPNFASFQPPEVLKRAQAFLPAFITSTDRILSNPEARQASQMDVQIASASQQFQSTDGKQDEGMSAAGATTINMEIGVGVYDVEDEQHLNHLKQQDGSGDQAGASELPPGMGFHQISTEPILRVLKQTKPKGSGNACEEHQALAAEQNSDSDSDSDEDSSDCEDRFMQFDDSSDEEAQQVVNDEEAMVDAQSLTTKSSGNGNKAKNKAPAHIKRPLIQELASHDFSNPEEESKDEEGSDVAVGQKRRFRDR